MQTELVFSLKQIFKAHLLLGASLATFWAYHSGLDYYIWFKRNEILADYAKLKINKEGIRQMRENHRTVLMEQNQAQIQRIQDYSKITQLRAWLISQCATGDVLEGCVGGGKNYQFYSHSKVKSIVGVDWMEEVFDKDMQKFYGEKNIKSVVGDVHNMREFKDNTFDTVVDTLGLESCYDVEKAIQEYFRVLKVGGKLILIERGQSTWKTQNFKIMRAASARLTSRGQVLHQSYEDLVRRVLKNKVKIIEKQRRTMGMVQGLVCQKLQ